MRLSFGGEGTRLEPPARLTVIAVFDQLYNDRRLVVNGSSSAVLCHDTDYAGKWTGRAYSSAAERSSIAWSRQR